MLHPSSAATASTSSVTATFSVLHYILLSAFLEKFTHSEKSSLKKFEQMLTSRPHLTPTAHQCFAFLLLLWTMSQGSQRVRNREEEV